MSFRGRRGISRTEIPRFARDDSCSASSSARRSCRADFSDCSCHSERSEESRAKSRLAAELVLVDLVIEARAVQSQQPVVAADTKVKPVQVAGAPTERADCPGPAAERVLAHRSIS